MCNRTGVRKACLFTPLLLILLLPAAATAQSVISAQAGLLYYVEGRVLVDGEPVPFDPAHFLHLQEGQKLQTADSRVELILVPDSYLRVDRESEIEMVSGELVSAEVRLLAGSATVDIRRIIEQDSVSILVGDARIRFRKKGLYRIDARSGPAPRVQVFQGKALISAFDSEYEIKTKHAITLADSAADAAIQPLDTGEMALLDDWSKLGDTGLRYSSIRPAPREDHGRLTTMAEGMRCAFVGGCVTAGLDCVASPRARTRFYAAGGSRIRRVRR